MRVEGTLAAPIWSSYLNHLSTHSALSLQRGQGEQALMGEVFSNEEGRWSDPLATALEAAGSDNFTSSSEVEVQT
jgi:hypothetical protein